MEQKIARHAVLFNTLSPTQPTPLVVCPNPRGWKGLTFWGKAMASRLSIGQHVCISVLFTSELEEYRYYDDYLAPYAKRGINKVGESIQLRIACRRTP